MFSTFSTVTIYFLSIGCAYGQFLPPEITNVTTYQAFTQVAPLPHKWSDMTALTFPEFYFRDGLGPRIYLVGGCQGQQVHNTQFDFYYCDTLSKSVYYYQPQIDKYTQGADMPSLRIQHAAARLNQYYYVVGGVDDQNNLYNDVLVYNTLTNAWSTLTTFTGTYQGRVNPVAFVYNNLLFVIGGYDPTTPNYQSYTDTVVVGIQRPNEQYYYQTPSTQNRGDARVAMLGSKAIIMGGFTSDDFFVKPLNVTESYDANRDIMLRVANLNKARGDVGAATLGGYVFAIGGETKDSNGKSVPVADVERYDPVGNTWIREQSTDSNRFRYIAATYNNTANGDYAIYLFGGQKPFDSVNDRYDLYATTIRYVPKSLFKPQSKDKPSLEPGAIAGIVIGGIVFIILVVLVIIVIVYGSQALCCAKNRVRVPSSVSARSTGTFALLTTEQGNTLVRQK